MIRPETFFVRPEDERPARRDGTCFYCHKAIGEKHEMDCVIKSRTVLISFNVVMVEQVCANETKDEIEAQFNDGTWCGTNLIDRLISIHKRNGCMCNRVSATFIGEAEEEDENILGCDVNPIEDYHEDR